MQTNELKVPLLLFKEVVGYEAIVLRAADEAAEILLRVWHIQRDVRQAAPKRRKARVDGACAELLLLPPAVEQQGSKPAFAVCSLHRALREALHDLWVQMLNRQLLEAAACLRHTSLPVVKVLVNKAWA